MSCLKWARNNPEQFRHVMTVAAIIGAIIGVLLLVGLYEWHGYIESIRPAPPILESIDVSKRDEFGSVKVTIKYVTAPTKKCIRLGAHMMTPRRVNEKSPEIDLMAGSVAGDGYSAVTNDRFTLGFYFPSSVNAGEYVYSYRRFMRCDPFRIVPFQDEVSGYFTVPPKEAKGIP